MHYTPPIRDPEAFYIEANGTVSPTLNFQVEAPIQRSGNTYTLTGNITGHSLWVQCNGVVVDGAGFSISGYGDARGVVLNCTKNVTVKNLVIENLFGVGIEIKRQFGPPYDSNYNPLPNPYQISSSNTISNCTIRNIAENGIVISSSSSNTIAQTKVTGCGGSAVHMSTYDETQGNTISDCLLQNSSRGVEVSNAQKVNIVRNSITDNKGYGVEIASSSENLITSNRILNNSGGGILISESTKCTIKENTVAYNTGWGIRLERNQKNNQIYRNNFINNTVAEGLQVSIPLVMGVASGSPTASFSPGLGNQWSSGSEGNYWSDYWTRYLNASEMGSTGFGNTPFFINENNIDYYPLVKPYGEPEVAATLTPTSTPTLSPTPSPSPPNSTSPNTYETQQPVDSAKGNMLSDQTNILVAGTIAAVALVTGLVLANQRRASKGS